MEAIENPRLRLALVLLSLIAVQKGISSHLTLFGVAPNLLLLAAIAAGLASTPDRGAVIGFIAGLSFDFITQGPIGLAALTYSLVGYVAGRLQAGVVRSSRLLPVVAGALFSAGGELLNVAFGQIVGQSQMLSRELGLIVAVTAVVNGLLGPLFVRMFRWGFNERTGYATLSY